MADLTELYRDLQDVHQYQATEYRDEIGLCVGFLEKSRKYFVGRNGKRYADQSMAKSLDVDLVFYQKILREYGGQPSLVDNTYFNTREEAQRARDELAKFLYFRSKGRGLNQEIPQDGPRGGNV